jgi:hypothetical protein
MPVQSNKRRPIPTGIKPGPGFLKVPSLRRRELRKYKRENPNRRRAVGFEFLIGSIPIGSTGPFYFPPV